jgi:hypothetical protein
MSRYRAGEDPTPPDFALSGFLLDRYACPMQVARALGMALEHFIRRCRFIERGTVVQGELIRAAIYVQ